jgi:hypothetical protein
VAAAPDEVPFVIAPSPLACFSFSSVGVISLPLSSKILRRISRLRSDFTAGVAEAARSVERCGLPGVVKVLGPGWNGCRPRGVSAVTRKCPVKGGPIFEGRVCGST